jgi:DNA replicative helicase MCM subunit Mcm2 (Cdc46/Mcm family)
MSDMRDDQMRNDVQAADADTRTDQEMRDERMMADHPRGTEREDMRTNPEVMGRTEPDDVPGRRGGPGTVTETPEQARTERRMRSDEVDTWPDMRQYKTRMAQIHSQFIDDPKAAVKNAEELIDEMVDYIAKSMHEQVQRWHKDVEGNADTEKLRLMMREFSHMMDRFEGRRAA